MQTIAILTDHKGYGNHLPVCRTSEELSEYPNVSIAIVSRDLEENASFFRSPQPDSEVYCRFFDENFCDADESDWLRSSRYESISRFDTILIRLDPPVEETVLNLFSRFPNNPLILNDPIGITNVANKSFLINYPDLVPGIKYCETIEDIMEGNASRRIVLKPLRGFGGRGLVRIFFDTDEIWIQNERQQFRVNDPQFAELCRNYLPCVKMRYLSRVIFGDKRVCVINGEILGSYLRIPKPGSWLANVTHGSTLQVSPATEEERYIVRVLSKDMDRFGIIFYGIDTIEDDDGKRVLSEINVLNPGGVEYLERLEDKNLFKTVAKHIMDRILSHRL